MCWDKFDMILQTNLKLNRGKGELLVQAPDSRKGFAWNMAQIKKYFEKYFCLWLLLLFFEKWHPWCLGLQWLCGGRTRCRPRRAAAWGWSCCSAGPRSPQSAPCQGPTKPSGIECPELTQFWTELFSKMHSIHSLNKQGGGDLSFTHSPMYNPSLVEMVISLQILSSKYIL